MNAFYQTLCRFLLITISLLPLVGCNSRQAAIDDLRSLSEEAGADTSEFTEEDWNDLSRELEAVNEKLEAHRGEYTDSELNEIGRLKGRIAGAFTRNAIRSAATQMEELSKQLGGAVEGFTEAFEDASSAETIN